MKKLFSDANRLLAIIFLPLIINFSCNKSAVTPSPYIPTEMDAAAIIANTILPQYGGMIAQINNGQSIAQKTTTCGVQIDSAVTGVNQKNATIVFNYSLLWHFNHTCGNSALHVGFSGDNSYEGFNYVSKDQSTGSWIFQNQATTWLLTGNTSQSGSQKLKSVGNTSFTSTVEFNNINITIDQVSKQITIGKLEVKMYDSSNSGFYYNGEITFNGNNKASLILNSGRVYPLSW